MSELSDYQLVVLDDELGNLVTKYTDNEDWIENERILDEYFKIRNSFIKLTEGIGSKNE